MAVKKRAAGASSRTLNGKVSSNRNEKGANRSRPRPNTSNKPTPLQLELQIQRSDDEDDIYTRRRPKPSRAPVQQESSDDEDQDPAHYQPESDEASQIASSDEDDDQEQHDGADEDKAHFDALQRKANGKLKTVSASQLAFLSGLDSNKELDISQKDAKKMAKELKRSDRKEIEENRRYRDSVNRTADQQDSQDSLDLDSEFDDESDFEEDEYDDDLPTIPAPRKDYHEYSDVSEGESIGDSESESEAVARPDSSRSKVRSKQHKRGVQDDEDTEATHLARLGKRKARQDHEEEQERQKRVRARLPVRKLASDPASDQDSEEENPTTDSDQDTNDVDDHDADGAGDRNKEPKAGARNRAVHKPLPQRDTSPSTSDEEAAEAATRRAATLQPHSSITHSSRFNLTAPYEILLQAHPSRLPAPPRPSKSKAASQAKALAARHRAAVGAIRSQTILLAKNQIASLSSQIIADPEVNLGLLKRLLVFARPTIAAPPEKVAEIKQEQAAYEEDPTLPVPRPTKVEVDPAIRQLAILSMLAVLVDILPGYRIRSLSEQEQSEKVGQEVARRREYEAGLVATYRDYLELCELELKNTSNLASGSFGSASATGATSPLHTVVLRVFTTLATRATHFNYRQNILRVIVARMSRRMWSKEEWECFAAVRQVVRQDRQGEVSLEVVRLIHRMTKERHYKVNSRVLDVLLDLRLKDELGNKRSSMTRAVDLDAEAQKEREEAQKRREAMKAAKSGKGKAKPKEVRKGLGQHLSKKEVKRQRELKAIQAEMKEAEATVDLEERERNQTETLKLVFVLYFTILKMDVGSVALPVLESAFKGLSIYAHRVNVDFFRDLLKVLRHHVAVNAAKLAEETGDAPVANGNAGTHDDEDSDVEANASSDEEGGDEAANILLDQNTLTRIIRHTIVALKTTFDLFLGQPSTAILNLDLTDLLSHFYHALFYLPFVSESHLMHKSADPHQDDADKKSTGTGSLLDLALDSLASILVRSRTRFDATTLAAFAKRLTIISLHVSSPASLQTLLNLVSHILAKQSTSSSGDSQLALLDLEDRSRNGTYQTAGKNLTTSQVLTSGQTIVWELAKLEQIRHNAVSAAAQRVWALKEGR
ncbi:NOC3p-domain-containing protein [Testicularia cyperi]|uniref:NOC3p-domain-containing protein n=1 Tax=Testicularia cyperi TaxID=1882483 RepID=A0A317XIT2_9BASI|nr:NOC3p-domain-containing protein [Testicularia cyperi]